MSTIIHGLNRIPTPPYQDIACWTGYLANVSVFLNPFLGEIYKSTKIRFQDKPWRNSWTWLSVGKIIQVAFYPWNLINYFHKDNPWRALPIDLSKSHSQHLGNFLVFLNMQISIFPTFGRLIFCICDHCKST